MNFMNRKMELSRLTKGLLLWLIIVLSGCGSLGKGIAEVVLGKIDTPTDTEDTRVCQVRGKPFAGIAPSLLKRQGKTKVLMIHGVGDKLAGYSTEFLEKLAKELNITARSSHYKDIQLTSAAEPKKNLGNLRIIRLQNADSSKELLFYELTWSEITRAQKELLGFDNSGEYSFRREEINDMLKKFTNDTAADPIIYLGESRKHILRAFSEALCWMGKDGWEQIPNDGRLACTATNSSSNINQDDFIFISHSLGSRITIDGLQQLAAATDNPKTDYDATILARIKPLFQKKKIQIFMLSNQLPMLQLGEKSPEIVAQKANYCLLNGSRYSSRLFSEASLVVFSDPNDLFSYAIPHHFSEKYLDSRLCVTVTNVNINVAKVFDAFGMGKFTNPMEAHVSYSKDDRVVAMIAEGMGNEQTAPFVKQKCEWTEITD